MPEVAIEPDSSIREVMLNSKHKPAHRRIVLINAVELQAFCLDPEIVVAPDKRDAVGLRPHGFV